MACQVSYCTGPQPESGNSGRNPFCACSTKVICFFAMLLALALGLILGALFALVIIDALPAVIAFAVTMAVLMIALLIFRFCFCCRIRRC